ncbi:MAG: CHASE2 domain-containing protein [Candidatus Puniceispirillaceae bacterium]
MAFLSQIARPLLMALILPVLLAIAAISDVYSLRSNSRDLSLDLYTQIAPFDKEPELAKQMVFIDIDEASLARYGQWPWPRQYMAVLLQNIGLQEPAAIAFDVLFSEDDRFNAPAIEALGGLADGDLSDVLPDGDALFGEMLSYTPSILAFSLTSADSANTPFLPASVSVIGDSDIPLLTAKNLLSPVAKLQQAPGSGFVSLSLERDSIVRNVPLIARFDEDGQSRIVPSISLEMLRLAQGAKGHILKISQDTGTTNNQIRSGRVVVNADEFGRLPLHHGYSDRFTIVSASDVFEDVNLFDRLNGAFVLIGASAAGLKDIHSTNLEAAIPGGLIHLQALHQMLSGHTLKSSQLLVVAEIAIAFVISVIIGLIIARVSIIASIITMMFVLMATAFGAFQLFVTHAYLTNAVMMLVQIGVASITLLMVRAFREEANRRQLRGAFGQYLSPTMVKEIEQSGQSPELGGVTTDISVMFMDVRGFTTLSETLSKQPQTLTKIINIILDEATSVIMRHGGTLDKYIGDAIMAFWNAPIAQADHAKRAIEAAIALDNHLDHINAMLAPHLPEAIKGHQIRIGVGIATGEVVVGNFGSKTRLSYSVVGDTVNLAARLEPFGKQTGLPLAFSHKAATGADHPDLIEINAIPIRGRAEAEIVHSHLPLSQETRAFHDEVARLAIDRPKSAQKDFQKLRKHLSSATDYPKTLLAYYDEQFR